LSVVDVISGTTVWEQMAPNYCYLLTDLVIMLKLH